MSVPEISIPVEVVDVAINGWFSTLPDSRDQQEHFRIRMRAALAAAGFSAAGDALDAERYRTWRDAMVADDTEFRLTVAAALPSEVGDTRPPTSAEWDAGIDAAIAAQRGDTA
ncbi:hypothetical protein [Achromobacter aegrifaciens]|uniref:hypothetical protein n=1 Tax=Achromobacter aegrifaciens TaxID=1287736 RepID=UPI00320B6BD2